MKAQFISSRQNPRFRAAFKLKTSRGRKKQQRFIIFGQRELVRAIAGGRVTIAELYIPEKDEEENDLVSKLASHGIDVFQLPPELFSQLQYGERVEAIVAVAERPQLAIEQLSVPDHPLVVMLQGIEKPGNVGAVLRTMDAVAADALILCDPQCDVFHPNAIRSSMGSVFSIPMAIATSDEAVAWCKQKDISIYAASDSGATNYTSIEMTHGIALTFGNEANGLSDIWMTDRKSEGLETPESKFQQVAIPMRGISDSLNISVAAAVMLFEARRQRDLASPQ